MAVATHLKSMDFLMFAQAAEGLTHVRGIIVSFVAMLLGGACLFLGVYIMGSSPRNFWPGNAVYLLGVICPDRGHRRLCDRNYVCSTGRASLQLVRPRMRSFSA